MRRYARVIALFVGCLLLLITRSASSQPLPMTFAEIASEANLIVRGYVADQRAEWITGEDGTGILTLVTFRIERTLKGDAGIQISLEFLGGTIGDTILEVSHVPTFEIGDRAVLFLNTTQRFISPVVGSEQGLFPIVERADGDYVVSHNGAPFSSISDLGVPPAAEAVPASPLPLASFESELLRVIRELQ